MKRTAFDWSISSKANWSKVFCKMKTGIQISYSNLGENITKNIAFERNLSCQPPLNSAVFNLPEQPQNVFGLW